MLRARLGRIAEHRRLEVEHRESERFARSVLDSLDAHIAVLDHAGRILAVNKAWRDFAASNGAGDADVSEGLNYHEICRRATGEDGEEARKFSSGIRDVLAGRIGLYEQEYPCHASHRRRWFVGRVTPFVGEGPRRVVISHVNITERVLAAEALRQTEQRFRLLVQNSSDIITALTADGIVLYESASIERILGYRPEARVGKSVLLDPIVHPEDLARKCAFLEDAVQKPGVPISAEFRLRHSDGSWRIIEAVGQNLISDPNVGAIVANYRDVTERKQAEERATQSERLAAIGQMITALTHESRNALQRGQANLEMLSLVVDDRQRSMELIGRQQRALDDLTRLHDEVRNYAAPIRLDYRECELSSLWRPAWENLKLERGCRQVELLEDLTCSELRCLADPHRMNQVYRILLENALAACSDPVEIALRCAICTLEGRPAVRLAIRDNGPGLASQPHEKFFEPFYTTKTKGTGLGLAIARRIIEAHGGIIGIGAGDGPGAEFVITLPREPL